MSTRSYYEDPRCDNNVGQYGDCGKGFDQLENVKDYAEYAHLSAISAKASADSASTSADIATDGATSAAASKEAAINASNAAYDASLDAKASATLAEESVTIVQNAEKAAKVSEDNAKISEDNAKASENSASNSSDNASASAAAAKASEDRAAEILEEVENANVDRGAWDPTTDKYPNTPTTNSKWSVSLPDGVLSHVFDGTTWSNGDGLVYILEQDKFQQIKGASGVTSVNGKTGAVVLGATDVGALPITGGTLTGQLVVDSDTETIRMNAPAGSKMYFTGYNGSTRTFWIGRGSDQNSDITMWSDGHSKGVKITQSNIVAMYGNDAYPIYHVGNKPAWSDVGGNNYWRTHSESPQDYITPATKVAIESSLCSEFRPDTTSDGKITLGTSSAKWKDVWSVGGNFEILTATQGLHNTSTGGTWISQRDSTDNAVQLFGQDGHTTGQSFSAWIKSKQTNHSFTIGSLSNSQFGFYGFTNTETENQASYGAYLSVDGSWSVFGTNTTITSTRSGSGGGGWGSVTNNFVASSNSDPGMILRNESRGADICISHYGGASSVLGIGWVEEGQGMAESSQKLIINEKGEIFLQGSQYPRNIAGTSAKAKQYFSEKIIQNNQKVFMGTFTLDNVLPDANIGNLYCYTGCATANINSATNNVAPTIYVVAKSTTQVDVYAYSDQGVTFNFTGTVSVKLEW